MELASKYNPADVEGKWYQYWLDHKLFSSKPDGREPYTVVIPPPNVTGVLHMGHVLNETIQDILVRRARMDGKNACWVPGTDHASIATEAKVVNRLAEKGIKKTDLTREEFLKYAWEWTDEHGGIILKQLRKLGASCDWDRTAFTMDEKRSESVIKVFCDLYNKGLIYRGVRMVNWDPKALTALSDEEVIYKEEHSKLYYLKYMVAGEDGQPDESGRYAVVATTRPETIMGDTAMCINPNDPKNTWLKGQKVIVPLVGRCIPVIEDDYVDIEFGTGCLKVTPAHDVNDYMLGEKYNLPSIDIFNDNGTISEAAGMYVGMDRFDVRKQICIDLEKAGLLEKVEDYTNKVGFSERTNVPIEPKLSMQWFLKMEELARPALKAVMEDTVRLVPAKFKNTYRYWMENVKDWCISRQLWWGQQIPAYYLPEGGYVVAETPEEALEAAREKTGNPSLSPADLRQDPDVLDTWFSSWLWPISVFDGINNPENDEIKYYYPTNDLVTGPDILFFWVARMIIAGYEYRGEKPFGSVYLTGIVRDKLRRKMSKSLGNSPDPIELIDRYGADGVRVAMLLCSAAGSDLLFDESLCEQGRNFGNKIWNAYRLVQGWQVDERLVQCEGNRLAVEWFDAMLNRTLASVEADFAAYRISEALMQLYKLFWDEFSGWYLEMVKPAYQQPIDRATLDATLGFFDKLLRVLHPFMPFLTEELWQNIAPRKDGESLMMSRLPEVKCACGEGSGSRDAGAEGLLAGAELLKEAVSGVRNIRKEHNLPNKEALELCVIADENYPAAFAPLLEKMANLSAVRTEGEKLPDAAAFVVKTTQYFVPLPGKIDAAEELPKLEAELEYLEGFLASVNKKLSNERFVQSAPEKVVANERAKQADAEAKIASLRERIAALK